MATTRDRAFSRQLSTLFNVGAIRDLNDGQLLERFARGEGEAAELAFAALVERHGAMVLRVCRAQLNDPHETQDAFQATFLVLVEKARGLWVRESLGPWLHQVALRTSSCARSSAIRRRRLERIAAERAAARDRPEHAVDPEPSRILHREIDRLPEHYRVPIVLCDLEGRTCEEAARVMGRPVGTVKCWRARGRDRLRRRLIRAGLAPTAALEVALAGDAAGASALSMIAEPTARAAAGVLSDRMTAGVVPASVSTLVKGVIQSMLMSKLRTTAAGLCVLTFLGVGLAAAVQVGGDDPRRGADDPPAAGSHHAPVVRPSRPTARPASRGVESWPMTLKEAIRIGLENSELIRVIPPGGGGIPIGGFEPTKPDPGRTDADAAPIVIARRKAHVDRPRFQADLMAEVRSIEQQYWNLGVAYVQLWAAQEAVDLAEEALKWVQERGKAGRGNEDGLAEVRQRLEQFGLDVVTRTSDVIDHERRLRNLLGLPPADDRRIIPVTPPTDARLEPDWDRSVATMMEKQPDILRARALLKEAEERRTAVDLDRVAGAFLPDLAGDRAKTASADVAGSRATQLERQRAFLQQVVHQSTHSLARFFLEIDSNYKQFRTASRLREAAAQRLEAHRVGYEHRRITIDRLLDAVSQYATAVATEAQYKATYNIALVALEECKGTLLEHDNITAAEDPRGAVSPDDRPDAAVGRASHQLPSMSVNDRPAFGPGGAAGPAPPQPAIPTPIGPLPPGPRGADGDSRAEDERTKADAGGTTYSFRLTIGAGPRPFEIRGSFTVTPGHDGR